MEIGKNAFKKVIKEDYEEVFMDDEKPKVTRPFQVLCKRQKLI